MKKYTKKFLNGKAGEGKEDENTLFANAEKAEEQLGMPRELWIELSDYFPKTIFRKYLKENQLDEYEEIDTSFMAGFICGWAECNRKIK